MGTVSALRMISVSETTLKLSKPLLPLGLLQPARTITVKQIMKNSFVWIFIFLDLSLLVCWLLFQEKTIMRVN
jgi:hypothetical protein